MSTEKIILTTPEFGTGPIFGNPDPEIRFALPNERQLKQASRRGYSTNNEGTRKIGFNGNGAEVSQLINLPFRPSGL